MRKNTKEVKFSSIASHKRLAFFDNISEQVEAKFVLKNSFKRAIQR